MNLCLLYLCLLRATVPLGTLSFMYLDYTAVALAKVWTNKAKLPNTQTMLSSYEKTVEERGGFGKYVLFWGPERSEGNSTHSFLSCN